MSEQEKTDQSRSDQPQLRAGESDPRGEHRGDSIFDVRSYDAGKQTGDWNYDVPLDVQRELIKCAVATNTSMDYLCAIYRKGATQPSADMVSLIDREVEKWQGYRDKYPAEGCCATSRIDSLLDLRGLVLGHVHSIAVAKHEAHR